MKKRKRKKKAISFLKMGSSSIIIFSRVSDNCPYMYVFKKNLENKYRSEIFLKKIINKQKTKRYY